MSSDFEKELFKEEKEKKLKKKKINRNIKTTTTRNYR